MQRIFGIQPYFKRVILFIALGVALMTSCVADADVIITTSYRGNWQVLEYFGPMVGGCGVTTSEAQIKSCVDVSAISQGYTGDGWMTPDSYAGCDPIRNPFQCTTESFTGHSGGSAEIGMDCPNGGSPNPSLGPQHAGPVPGWCLILGIAPPPATVPTCDNGLPPPSGQSTCASVAEVNTGNPDDCQCGGDPINIGSGNMYFETTDYQTGGVFPIKFTRSYNSAIAVQGVSPDGADQMMGTGWTSSISGPHLYVNIIQQFYTCEYQDGQGNPVDFICPATSSPVLVTVWRPDGRQSVFSGTISDQSAITFGGLSPQPGAQGQLSYGPLPAPLPARGYANGYSYLRMDGYTEYFNDLGQLLMVRNLHGLLQVYEYNSANQVVSVKIVRDTTFNPAWDVMNPRITFTYDSSNRIHTMTSIYGQNHTGAGIYTYNYDAKNNLAQVQYPDGSAVQYLYEDANYPNAMTGIVDENGNRYSTWGYDSAGRANLSFNGNGTSTSNNTSIVYNTDGSADVTEPTGLIRHLDFTSINGIKLLTHASAPCILCQDKSQSLSYDSNGFIASKTDFKGNVTNYTHDSLGHELTKIEGYGTQDQRTTVTTWSDLVNLPKQVTIYNASNQPVLQTNNCYNYIGTACSDSTAIGAVWTTTRSDPATGVFRTVTYTYRDATEQVCAGAPKFMKGPRTDTDETTSYAIGAFCEIGGVSYKPVPGGNISLGYGLGVDGDGLITGISYPSLNASQDEGLSFSYDARQRILTKALSGHDGLKTIQLTYDLAGNLTKVTLPTGGYVQYFYDTSHHLTSILKSNNDKIVFTLDALGNRIHTKYYDADGTQLRDVQSSYNNLNQLHQEIGGAGQITAYAYDANGNLTTVTDPRLNNTTFLFDSLNRRYGTVDSSSGNTTYALDALNHITDITDPRGLNIHYVYDAFGDVLTEVSPDKGTTQYTYDLGGNQISKTDSRGKIENRVYDAINRLTLISYPQNSAKNITLIYDQIHQGQNTCAGFSTDSGASPFFTGPVLGKLLCIADSSGTTVFSGRDGYGNLTGKVVFANGIQTGVGYIYDLSNNLIQIGITPGTSSTVNLVNYQRDDLGRVTEVDGQNGYSGTPFGLTKNITYLPFGPLTSLRYSNSLLEIRTFDADYRLTGISIPGVMGLGYAYDADDNITAITDSVNATGRTFAQILGYDAMNRLGSANGSYGNFTYTYDLDGNMTTKTTVSTGKVRTYAYDSLSNHLLTSTGGSGGVTNFTYDAFGNLDTDGTYNYNHDLTERLTSVGNGTTTVGTYTYNGLGQRVKKVADGTTSYFIYDEEGHLLMELDGTGGIRESFVWLGDRPIAYFPGAINNVLNAHYIHVDQLNTPRVITSHAQTIGWMWQSDPFGSGAAAAISFGSGFMLRLPGHYYDSETGDDYNYFRQYDPGTGRYIESDPMGLGGGINTYGYAGDNPVKSIDPYGLCGTEPDEKPKVPVPGYKAPKDCIHDTLRKVYGDEAALRAEFFTATNLIPNTPNAKAAQEAAVAKGGLVYGPQLFQQTPLATGAARVAPAIDIFFGTLSFSATWQYWFAYRQCYYGNPDRW